MKHLGIAFGSAMLLACSSSSNGGSQGAPDAGAGDTSHPMDDAQGTDAAEGMDAEQDAAPETAPDAPVGDAGCNAVVNAAPVVQEMYVPSAAPNPGGGSIPDGTYFLTAASVYDPALDAGGPSGITYQYTSVVTAGTFQIVQAETGGASDGGRYGGTFAIDGGGIVVTYTCGSTGNSSLNAIDSDGGLVTLYGPDGTGKTSALTFTKQ